MNPQDDHDQLDDRFSRLMTSLDPPMAIVTTTDGTRRAGCLIGFHSQCSIEPLRYALWLSKANHTFRVAKDATAFAVHFLDGSERHRQLAELFGTTTGDETDKFADCATDIRDGLPLLRDCPNVVVGPPIALHEDGSDHVCIVIEPVEVRTARPLVPLRFHAVQHLRAGHDADEIAGSDLGA